MRQSIALVLALSLTACTGKNSDAPSEPMPSQPDPMENTPMPQTGSGDTTDAGGMNSTAFALQDALFSEAPRNEIFSAASISVAFGMLAAGAKGETADELYAGFNLSPDTAQTELGALVQGWNKTGDDAPLTLRVANRVWLDNTIEVMSSYTDLTRDTYGAEATRVDFMGSPDGSRQQINTWVEDQTNDRIKDLLPAGSVLPSTRMVLTNAIYFKADWQTAFDAELTQDKPFTLIGGESVSVPTMHSDFILGYAETDAARMVLIPYDGGTADFIVVLPKGGDLMALEQSMNASTVEAWFQAAGQRTVDLDLPRFELNATYDSLAAPLAELGITRAFSSQADLSGISSTEGLYVSDAIHKAFILVDETGTEAAAATGIMVRTTSMEEPEPPVVFHADQPFWFGVRDRVSGTLLFTGHVVDPRG